MGTVRYLLTTLVLFFVVGCTSMERGGIFYQAATPEAKRALGSRIEALRSELRNDSRFAEEVTAYYPLRFIAVKGSEFYGSLITYAPAAPGPYAAPDLLTVGCSYEMSRSDVGRRLRDIIDSALGLEVLKLLQVDARYSAFVQFENMPNHVPEPSLSSGTPPAKQEARLR